MELWLFTSARSTARPRWTSARRRYESLGRRRGQRSSRFSRVGNGGRPRSFSALPSGTPRGRFRSLLMSAGRKPCVGSQPLRTQLSAPTPRVPSTKEIVNDVFEHLHRKYHISPMRHLANVVVTLQTKHTAEPCKTEVLPRFQWVNEESRGSPCDPAGRSLRPFWPPFTRRKPRFVIFTGLGFQRRSIDARYPSNPWHSRRDQLVKASVRTREPRSRSFWRGAMRESSLPLTSCPTPTAKTGSRSCSTASAASSPQQDGTLSRRPRKRAFIQGLLAGHAEPSGDEPGLRSTASPQLAIRARSRTSSRRS